MDLDLDGIVSAVGHRGVYSKGNYNAEFRGTTATDVPIKVQFNDVPDGVPSGIRMDMTITTGFGVAWIDNLMGHSLATGAEEVAIAPQDAEPSTLPNDSASGESVDLRHAIRNRADSQNAQVSLALAAGMTAISDKSLAKKTTHERSADGR